ncbi:exodeoxyribonuclease V subunit beta [Kangiella sp.]|uniref:UvrD-helicase domain-containing protein n=1 Tax=Kangiella sp. TaxID=1920245 RepID=UPI0019B82A16|nr:UvrD-helicase domain-containing protein [Kangiella sp.]MBD3654688.1 UvrD-helicase domain-containing protein [Kangiella sp.]
MTNFMVPPDQGIREQAIDFSQSFIVQAPAGAGKTSLLTQRILNLLTTVDNPEEIVAITFTRKAAAEMRHRLIDALLSANEPEPDAPHDKTTWRLARKVLQRNDEFHWGLLENSHRLRIMTFDAMSGMIANQMPLLSNLGGSLGITNFAAESYQRAAETIVNYLDDEDYGPHILKLLAHLDSQVEKLIGLLAQMLAKRDQWLRLLGAGELDIEILQDGINQVVQLRLEALQQFQAKLEHSTFLQAIHFAAGFLETGHELEALKNVTQLPEFNFTHIREWQAIAEFSLVKAGTFKKQLNKKIGLLADSDLQGEDKKTGKQIKADLKELFQQWSEVPEFAETLNDIRSLPSADYSEEQQQILYSLLHLLRLVTVELTVDFQSNAEADFIEIALAADRALGYFDEPSELALKLDYKIKHLLVDEFQDTSFTQYQLLSKLIAGWQPGDGRTLFLVGDPMQSIYRFREANVGLFIKTQQEGINGFPVTSLQLTANFRSSPAIINWVNRRFEAIFPQHDDVLLGAVSYSPAEAMKPQGEQDFVDFLTNFDQPGWTEAEYIAQSVQRILKQDPKGSIAVLVRGRAHAQEIMQQFRVSGISYYAKDMEYLSHKSCVTDLMMLCRLLLQPQDGIAWTALLKSPYMGLTLAELSHLQQRFNHHYWKLLEEFETVDELTEPAKIALRRLRAVLSSAIANAGRKPLSQLLESCWLALGGPSVLLSQDELEDVYAVFNLLIELEADEWPLTFERIQAALAELYANQQADKAQVEIMTMHKSKGLEFDTVILPSLQRQKRADSHQLLLWEEFTSHGQQGYLLAPIQAAERQEPIYQLARDIQSKKAAFEDARLLYVAATRAKKRLLLSCELKLKYDEEKGGGEPGKGSKEGWSYSSIDKRSLLYYLLPHYENTIDRKFEEIISKQGELSEQIDAPTFYDGWYRLKQQWQPPEVDNQISTQDKDVIEREALDFDWASDVARVVGLVVHKQLELIGLGRQSFERLEKNQFESLLPQLAELLSSQKDIEQAFEKAKKALRNTMQDSRGQWLLKPHQNAVCEWELTGMVNDEQGRSVVRNFIIDRSFVDDAGVRWIVDYKTGDHQGLDIENFIASERERYAPQLSQYKELVSRIEQRPIKTALYFPMLNRFEEL